MHAEHHNISNTIRSEMRFVSSVFGVIFTLLSLVEFAGGSFWMYRAINVAAIVSWWVACRPEAKPKPKPVEEIELVQPATPV